MKERAGYALDTLRPVVLLVADTAGNAGIPGLQLGLLALSDLLQKIQVREHHIIASLRNCERPLDNECQYRRC